MTVVAFPSRALPHTLDNALREARWEEVFDALNHGAKMDTMLRGMPFGVAILKAWMFHHPLSQGLVPPLPPSFRSEWLKHAPVHMNRFSSVGWCVRFGQWQLAEEAIRAGLPPDGESLCWEAVIEGHLERLPTQSQTVVRTSGLALELEHVLSENALSFREDWLLGRFVGQAKRAGAAWPSESQPASNMVLSCLLFQHNNLLKHFFTQGVDPNKVFFTGEDEEEFSGISSVQVAIEANNPVGLTLLLEHHADHHMLLEEPLSLMEIAVMADRPTCLDALLEHLPSRKVAEDLPFALIRAVANSHIAMAETLRDRGAPLHLSTTNGYTLMHQAAMTANKSMACWLLGQGLTWDIPSSNGIYPRDLMKQHNPELFREFNEGPSSNVTSLQFKRTP